MKKDRKGEFLKDWIESKMLKHDWFNGVKYVVIESYRFRNNKRWVGKSFSFKYI